MIRKLIIFVLEKQKNKECFHFHEGSSICLNYLFVYEVKQINQNRKNRFNSLTSMVVFVY